MVCYGTEWRDTVVSPPSSEPPPPYSPPRSKSKLIASSKIPIDTPYVHGHQNTPREILKKALNHGPSSAFSPPTPRHHKNEGVMGLLPPPYSSVPSYPGLQKQSPSRTTKDVTIPRNQIPQHNWVPNHPTGPVLKIGKSLDIPKKGSVNAHSHITAHKHPGKKEYFDPSSQSTPTSSRLAYVGIASTKERLNNQMIKERVSYSKSRTLSKVHDSINEHHHPTARARRDKPSKRNYKLDLNEAESMLSARAQPAHVAYPTAKCQNPQTSSNVKALGTNYPYCCSDSGSDKKTRLRSYRSLDELSDLLEEEASHIRFGSRSLDDLTEPLYENISFFKSQRVHNPIYGLESYVDINGKMVRSSVASSNFDSPPELPPRKNSKGQEEGEEVDIGIQLQKLKEIARVLGVKFQRGELSSTSSVGRSTSSSSMSSEKTRLRNAFALIDNTLQATLPKSPPMHRPPGVPARAPVIHDVSFLLNKEEQGTADRDSLPYLPEGPLSDKRGMSVASCSPETDCISQESGYSSVDSRSYCSSTNRSHKKGSLPNDRNEVFQKESMGLCGFSPKTFVDASPLRQQESQNEDLSRRRESRTPDYFNKNISPLYNKGQTVEEPLSLPCLSSSTPVSSPSTQKREISHKTKKSPINDNRGTLSPDRRPCSPHGILKNPHKTRQSAPVKESKGENQSQLGIYIKSVVPGGAADQDGRLQAGDQLLSVDGKSLVGISQEEAAQYMVGTGPVVTLEVARQGALYHGLAPLLSQPSPQVTTGMQDMRREPHPQQHPNPPFNPIQQQSQTAPPTHSPPHQHPPQQQQPHFPHHHQQPRMQASKSVPSLNSDFQHPAGGKSASHEVFNPAYSRTSSSTSLSQQHPHTHQHQQQMQHQQQYPVRSRSTQNLNEGNALTLSGRHPSSPALNTEDDRHYQNISFHQGPQDPRMGSQRGGRPPIFPPHSPPQEQGRPNSAFMQREDPRVAEPLQRPTSQQNLRPDMRYGPGNEDPRKRPNGFPMHQQPPGPGGGFSPSQGPGMNAQGPRQQYPRGHLKYNYPYGSQPQMSTHAHPSQMSPQGYYYTQNPTGSPQGIPPQPMSPQYANSPQSTSTLKQPPPTAPKPNRNSGSFGQEPAPEKPLRQTSIENNINNAGRPNGPARPPGPEEGYRDSPPPPPPPTSTHPLVQAGTRPTQSNAFGKSVPGIRGPWDRDEKEKYENRKREAARRWRDEQIAALENMGTKTPQEEERMNTLKLEREFQRRAEERLKGDEEDEDEDEDEDDDILEGESVPKEESRSGNTVLDSRPPNGEVADDDREKRADEIRRKQRELEAAREAEERLLREAQRRQEEEMLRRQQQQQQQQQLQQQQQQHHQQQRHQTQASQRLDSLVGAPLGSPNGFGTSNNTSRHQGYPPADHPHHPPSISPLPPERGSSYTVMHQHQTQDQLPTQHFSNRSNRTNEGAPIKRVQFSESSPVETHITYDSNANQEKSMTREDPDDFINEAELLMNYAPNRSTGNTPGVIGAQEVYRDPRQRRLMEQAQRAAASRGPGPEKLTFREKMKMFAKEAEEGVETPKDKLKHSRAQREIEHGSS